MSLGLMVLIWKLCRLCSFNGNIYLFYNDMLRTGIVFVIEQKKNRELESRFDKGSFEDGDSIKFPGQNTDCQRNISVNDF